MTASNTTIVTHNHLPFEESVTPEIAGRIQSLLRNNQAHAHEQIGLPGEPERFAQVYPALALVRYKSLQYPARLIEISPYWFCYSVSREAASVALMCLACDTEFTMPVTAMDATRSCPNCSFSQSVFRQASPEPDEMLAYLRAATRARQRSFEWEREFSCAIRLCRANGFAPDTWANLPRDKFSGKLKQVDLNTTPPEFRQVFQSYFRQFSQPSYPPHLDAIPGANEVEHIFLGSIYLKKSTGRYRRFSGGPDLEHGRYFSVCQNDSGNDNATMTAELLSYSSPEAGGFPVLYDSANLRMPTEVVELFSNGTLASIGPPFDPRKPALIVLVTDRPLTGDIVRDTEDAICVTACNLKIANHDVENVLDLRQARSQVFLATAVAQLKEVKVVGRLDEKGRFHSVTNAPSSDADTNDESDEEFMDLLSVITAPLRGGGEFHDAVGRLLRALGYGGLVFPSARRDCSLVDDFNGHMIFDGWSFVDFRDAGAELSDEVFPMLGMRGQGKECIARSKVYGAYSGGKYTFASGFHIYGAEERERCQSQRR